MKSIVVTIQPDGASKVETNGFNGVGCAAASKDVELALAGTGEVTDQKKPDFYATNTGAQATNQNQR